MTNHTTHATISVTVDVVLFCMYNTTLHILLIERKYPPYAGAWAIPGGFVDADESLAHAARRELFEETNVSDVYIEQFYTFGDPGRDPRRQSVSVAHIGLCRTPPQLATSDETPQVQWHPLTQLPPVLAFDHHQIIAMAWSRLQAQLESTTIAFELLPTQFTIADVHHVYQQILGESLDFATFQRALTATGALIPAPDQAPHHFCLKHNLGNDQFVFRWRDARHPIA